MPEPDRRAAAALTVVVVAYGAAEELRGALGALLGRWPVVVVDNSSSAAVRAVAEEAGAAYRDAGENLGFAAGVNLGLSGLDLTAGDVLLLNPDATVEPSQVERLAAMMRADPGLACVAPAQRHPATGAPVRVCWPFATPAGAWREALGLGRHGTHWDFVIASVCLVRGAALLEVGALDEGYFLYAEEADWQRRAVAAGWRVGYCPDASALHTGAGTETDDLRHMLRFHSAVERHVRKWHGRLGWRSYQAATVVTALRRALVQRGAARRRSLALAALYARGPHRSALRAGAVPARRHRVPALG